MKIYLDTSIYIAYDDEEFKKETRKLFRKIASGWFEVCYSLPVESELKSPLGKRIFKKYGANGIFLELTPKIVLLARTYIERRALPFDSQLDALHIALSTFYNIDYLRILGQKTYCKPKTLTYHKWH